MKPEEAIEKLRCPELPDGLVMVGLEARHEAIKALKKQISMKPNNMKSMLDFFGNYYTSRGNALAAEKNLIGLLFIVVNVDRSLIGSNSNVRCKYKY